MVASVSDDHGGETIDDEDNASKILISMNGTSLYRIQSKHLVTS